MKARTVRINTIFTSAMLLVYIGCIILNLLLALLTRNTTITLPAGMFLCLAVFFPTVVLLIYGIGQAKRKQGIFDLILSVLTLLVSLVWIIVVVLNWATVFARNLIYELFFRLDIAMSISDLLTILSYLDIAFMLFTTVVAIYLLITYLISVLRAKQKWLQIKAELHKPAISVLILVPNLLSLVQMIITRIMLNNLNVGVMNLDEYSTFVQIFSFGCVAVEIVLALAVTLAVTLFGLILKKQPVALPEQPELYDPELDDGFAPPAGVSAQDLWN